MAKQIGIIKLTGKLGDDCYYYTKNNGYLVRKITSVDAERIRNDPAFARVRENNTDFGRCAFGVKVVRAAFIPLFADVADSHMTSRLTQALMNVIKSDPISAPGMRRLELGNVALVRGFEFNNATSLHRVVKASYQTEVNPRESTCTVTITPSAGKLVSGQAGATHFRFLIGIAKIDFKTGAHTVEYMRAREMSVREDVHEPLVFTGRILPAGDGHLFVTLGVGYLQRIQEEFCVLPGKKHTALTLIHTETIGWKTAPAKATKYKIPVRLRRNIRHVYSLRTAVAVEKFDAPKRWPTQGRIYNASSEKALKGRDKIARARAPARAWVQCQRRYPSPEGAKHNSPGWSDSAGLGQTGNTL
jgi:hypothetical protein